MLGSVTSLGLRVIEKRQTPKGSWRFQVLRMNQAPLEYWFIRAVFKCCQFDRILKFRMLYK